MLERAAGIPSAALLSFYMPQRSPEVPTLSFPGVLRSHWNGRSPSRAVRHKIDRDRISWGVLRGRFRTRRSPLYTRNQQGRSSALPKQTQLNRIPLLATKNRLLVHDGSLPSKSFIGFGNYRFGRFRILCYLLSGCLYPLIGDRLGLLYLFYVHRSAFSHLFRFDPIVRLQVDVEVRAILVDPYAISILTYDGY